MKNVLGLLNLQEDNALIHELANDRPVEMIPFGGRYRLIDFALSNMVNSGIRTVGIMLPENSRPVLDHVRSGKDWDLARHHEGLSFLPARLNERRFAGDLKDYYDQLDFIEHDPSEYILLSGGNFVCKLDYNILQDVQAATQADIVVIYGKTETDGHNGVVLKLDEEGLVKEISYRQDVKKDRNLYLGVCFLKRRLFAEVVRSSYESGNYDFLFDVLARRLHKLRVAAVEHQGYAREINSTASYYQANMDLLDASVFNELFRRGHIISTKAKDRSPVRYQDSAVVKNSLIANGCNIAGEVENSILFREVTVERGAKIKNCIVMQNGTIKENAILENVICDKNVVISQEKWLKGVQEYPLIVNKNIVI